MFIDLSVSRWRLYLRSVSFDHCCLRHWSWIVHSCLRIRFSLMFINQFYLKYITVLSLENCLKFLVIVRFLLLSYRIVNIPRNINNFKINNDFCYYISSLKCLFQNICCLSSKICPESQDIWCRFDQKIVTYHICICCLFNS